jgi:hypothetical protein
MQMEASEEAVLRVFRCHAIVDEFAVCIKMMASKQHCIGHRSLASHYYATADPVPCTPR